MDPIEKILSGLSHLNLQGSITNKEPQPEGYGATCDVYSAWSTKHEKKVAIKQFRYFMAKDEGFAKVSVRTSELR